MIPDHYLAIGCLAAAVFVPLYGIACYRAGKRAQSRLIYVATNRIINEVHVRPLQAITRLQAIHAREIEALKKPSVETIFCDRRGPQLQPGDFRPTPP